MRSVCQGLASRTRVGASHRFVLQGMASTRVPRGMCVLPLRDSAAEVERLADGIVGMSLQDLAAFQRAAVAQMMGASANFEDALLQGMGGGGGGVGVAPGATAAAAAPAAGEQQGGTEGGKASSEAATATKKTVEKLTFDVSIKAFPPENKVKLIKELRSVCNLSIPDAKAAIEKAPGVVAKNIPKADAEKLQQSFEKLRAEVALS